MDDVKAKRETLVNFLGNIFVIAIVGAITAVGLYTYHFWQTPISSDPTMWGALGDYLGGILNPFFGFFALLALLLTLKIQSEELHLSREEMTLTRRELEGSKEALNKQNFETTFFNMLKSQRDITNNMRVSPPRQSIEFFLAEVKEPVYEGHKGIRHICRAAFKNMKGQCTTNALQKSSNHTLKEYVGELSHYFKSTKTLINFVDKTSDIDHEFYISLIEAQLTTSELVLIFLKGIQPLQSEFKAQIEKYGLLRNLEMMMFSELYAFDDQRHADTSDEVKALYNLSNDMVDLYSSNAYLEPEIT